MYSLNGTLEPGEDTVCVCYGIMYSLPEKKYPGNQNITSTY
jgi:hypothetical protein